MTIQDFDSLTQSLWDYDHPIDSETRFRALLDNETDMSVAQRLEIETQITRALGLQRKFDDAHTLLNRVESELDAITDTSIPRIRYLLERGRVYNSAKSDIGAARDHFQRAFDLASKSDEPRSDFYAVDAAHMLGIAAPDADKLRWNEIALDLARKSPDARAQGWIGSLYNNIGWTYHDLGDTQKALQVFQDALAWREAQNQPRETRIARWCVARAMRSLGQLDEALEIQQRLLAENEAAGDPDGYVHEEIAECLLALNRADEARPHFARAHELLSADNWMVENEAARLKRLRELGGMPDQPSL